MALAQGALPWITVPGTTVTGSGSLTFTVAPNSNNEPRSAYINLPANGPGNWHILVTQVGAVCTLALSPATTTAVVSGASGSFGIQTACGWYAYSNNSWITVPGGSGGSGNGTVQYTVAANACVTGRNGSMTVVAGDTSQPGSAINTVAVSQDGSPNNLSISPQARSFDTTGGTDRVTVAIGTGCSWSYYTDSSWIQIIGGGTGGGSGPSGITYTIPQNNGPARSGHIYVGPLPQVYTITQAGAAAPVPQLTAVVNAASYATGPIAPGEVIALGGTGMGPAQGVSAQIAASATNFPNTLSGVQVMFDGKYAAIPYYASATQINAIVPFEIAGQTSTQITVSYGGGTSAAVQAQVQPAAPGILTIDFTGAGQGAILNQDYSLNGKTNGASRGSVVMIYCIGMGQTNPASADGAVTAGQNTLAIQPVSVTIDGIPAKVDYAGGAPGAVAGLTQINAEVPANAHTGPVSVTIQIGSYQTQPGVTMVVQ